MNHQVVSFAYAIGWSMELGLSCCNQHILVGGLVAMFFFPINIGFLIIPIDELIFFQRGGPTTNQTRLDNGNADKAMGQVGVRGVIPVVAMISHPSCGKDVITHYTPQRCRGHGETRFFSEHLRFGPWYKKGCGMLWTTTTP